MGLLSSTGIIRIRFSGRIRVYSQDPSQPDQHELPTSLEIFTILNDGNTLLVKMFHNAYSVHDNIPELSDCRGCRRYKEDFVSL